MVTQYFTMLTEGTRTEHPLFSCLNFTVSMSQNKQTSMRKKADLRQLEIMFLTTIYQPRTTLGEKKSYDFL